MVQSQHARNVTGVMACTKIRIGAVIAASTEHVGPDDDDDDDDDV
jgi:hypothetical protein